MSTLYYVGLDVHKDSVSIAYSSERSRKTPTYYGQCGGSNLAVERALRSLAKKLHRSPQDLKVSYEAGPTGFVLARRLLQLGIDCVVMSPSKTERKAHEKVKTDKKDAQKVAKDFRNGDFTEVRVPPALDEAVRDLCRARTDAVDDLARSKQRLNSFLLRIGFNYSGKTKWTSAHMRYLRHLTVPHDVHKIVLEDYIQAIDSCMERVALLRDKMKDVLESWEWKPVVKALMACRGFQEVAAMTLISELGDLRRFKHPRQLMAFLGLVPDEESTGTRRRLGSITKCGNSHARWMLVECAQHFRRAPKVNAPLSKRQEGQSRKIKAFSWRMQTRLHNRYASLRARGKLEQKIIVAIARELSAFLWELQNRLGLSIPDYQIIQATVENSKETNKPGSTS